MMTEREKILDTIRKCLALGDKSRNPSEAEAETAIARAKALMDQYNLSMADVASASADATHLGEARTSPWSGMPQWARDLARVCDALFSTYHFYSSAPSPSASYCYKDVIVFCGTEYEVAMAVEVFKLLKLELYALAGRWDRTQPPDLIVVVGNGWSSRGVPLSSLTPGQRRTRKFKYMEGVAWTLHARAKKISEDLSAAQASKVTALVVQKSEDAKRWAEQKYSLKVRQQRDSGMHSDAADAGLQDGHRIGLDFSNKVRQSQSQPRKGGLLQ